MYFTDFPTVASHTVTLSPTRLALPYIFSRYIPHWGSVLCSWRSVRTKLCYDYTKLKAKRTTPVRYAPIEQHVSALTTTVATSWLRDADVSSSDPTIMNRKCQISQYDPDRGAQKSPRRTDSPDKGVFRPPRAIRLENTHYTSSDTGFDRGGEACEEAFHMELNVSLLIDQHWRRPVYRRKRTLSCSTR